MPKAFIDSAGYAGLLSSIRREMKRGIVEVRRAVERQKIMAYWAVGASIHHYVHDHVASGGIVRFYGRLSKDLNINSRTLQHCEQFFRYFPDPKPQGGLTWSHYRYLLSVENTVERQRWIKRIKSQDLSANQVRFALSERDIKDHAPASGQKLKEPARGAVYAYRLIPAGKEAGEKYPWYVDCGFKNLLEAPPSRAKLHNKYIYTSVKTGEGYSLRVTDVKAERLFTFEARLLRVIDGDTLHVIVDQGFGLRIRERLRLNGINAPEMSTVAGQKAKRWMESRLAGVPFLVVKTYRTDKYDRYIADVFYDGKLTDPQAIADHGAYLNQELIDAGHAALVKY
jgi:endonuclease YncB( thermonuclease family)